MSPAQQYHGQFFVDAWRGHKVYRQTVFELRCRGCTAHCAFVVTCHVQWSHVECQRAKLAPQSRVGLQKLTVPQLVRNFSRILWNRPVRHRIHNIPVLSHLNPYQHFPFYLQKIHFNSISACRLDLIPFKISSPKSCEHLIILQYVPHVSPLILYFITQIICIDQYSSIHSFLHHPVDFFPLGLNNPFSTLFCLFLWAMTSYLGEHSATAVIRRGNEVGCCFDSKAFESADVTCSYRPLVSPHS